MLINLNSVKDHVFRIENVIDHMILVYQLGFT